jgi:TonB-linked SusC/RagA family outer membrane protein
MKKKRLALKAIKRTFLSFLMVLCLLQPAVGTQRDRSTNISLRSSGVPLFQVFDLIRSTTDMKLVYSPNDVPLDKKVNVDVVNGTVETLLNQALANQGLRYIIKEDRIIISKEHAPQKNVPKRKISGKVFDEVGSPIPGVSVYIKGKENKGTITGADGVYTIEASKGDILTFSFIGMQQQALEIKDETIVNVVLKTSSQVLEEAVVVGYGTQKKASVVGSIQSVKSGELKIPSSNLSNSFAGKLAGVIAFQRTGEPGADGSSFYIRGISTFSGATNPLIILDGVAVSQGDLNALAPEVIESFSILKDATATALYGTRGANGVMIVTTKSGRDLDKARINIRVENSMSMATKIPSFVGGVKFMEMYNEAVQGRGTGEVLYSDDKIEGTRNKLDPYLYPNVNWYKSMFKKITNNQNANINILGGGKKIDYFMSASANLDNGVLKSYDLNSYKNNIRIQRYSFQNNLNAHLTNTTRLSLKLNTQVRDYNGPAMDASDLFGLVMAANPVDFPISYPSRLVISDKTIWGGKTGGTHNFGFQNPFAEMVKGYTNNFQSTVIATFDGEQKLDFVTEGLSLKGLVSFKNWSSSTTQRAGGYNQYTPTNRVLKPDGTYTYDLEKIGTVQDPSLGTTNSSVGDRSIYLQGLLEYNRTFAGKHNISAMALYNQEEFVANILEENDLIGTLPNRKQGVAGRLTYNYDNRYFIEGNFGYNGSENFAKGHRFGFFSSIAAGYIVSNEKYWEPVKSIVSLLKLRGSYGLVGNDDIGGDRFAYLSDIDLQNKDIWFTTGINQDRTFNGPMYKRFANPYITWEVGTKVNFGADVSFYNKLNVVFDIYREIRRDIFTKRKTIPASTGTASTAVFENLGEVKNQGFDFSVDYNQQVSRDLSITLKGTFTYAHNEIVKNDQPPFTQYPNLSEIGHPVNALWGLRAERLFIDDAEIANSALQQFGTYLPGDIKYTDITNRIDHLNQINSNDAVRMGYPTIPEIVYGFGPSIKYKDFDCSFYFQGVARTSFFISNFHPFGSTDIRGVLDFIAEDYWSRENPNVYAKYPRLSKKDAGNNTQNSSFWLRDGSFLKLKNAEVGYSFKFARLYINGMNLLTFSKFKEWDPEQGGGNGLNYPTQRVFNIGLQMTF